MHARPSSLAYALTNPAGRLTILCTCVECNLWFMLANTLNSCILLCMFCGIRTNEQAPNATRTRALDIMQKKSLATKKRHVYWVALYIQALLACFLYCCSHYNVLATT